MTIIVKKIALTLIISITFLLSALYAFNGFHFNVKDHHIIYTNDPDFSNQWKTVDSLEELGLTKSALTIVENIYQSAKLLNIPGQTLKALIYKTQYKQILEEGELETAIGQFEDEIAGSRFPLTPVLQSCAADLYWQYYRQNRWKFYNRTQTVGIDNRDITTWDLQTLLNKVSSLYDASISNEDSLKKTPITVFDPALTKGWMSAVYRPTLYDFLANRALDFYMNQEASVNNPAVQFNIDAKQGLAPDAEFVQTQFPSNDSASNLYKSILIFQKLIAFRMKDPNLSALTDINIKRLGFVRQNSLDEKIDSLYKNALFKLANAYPHDSSTAEVRYALAVVYHQTASQYKPLLNEEHKWDNTIALDQCEIMINKYPNTSWTLAAKKLGDEIASPLLSMEIEKVNLSGQPFRSLLKFKNVKQAYFRVIRSSDALELKLNNLDGKSRGIYLATLPFTESFSQNIPDGMDYQIHSAEIKIPALIPGQYMIISSPREDFSTEEIFFTIAYTQVSNLGYMFRRDYYSNDNALYCVDRNTGAPLADVKVTQYETHYNYKLQQDEKKITGNYVSDANGYVKLKSPNSYDNFYLNFYKGSDTLLSDDYFYLYQNNEQPEKLYTSIKLFTDRAIYRPGQPIYFKGIVIEGSDKTDYKIKTGFSTLVQLKDANYQKVGELTLTSNEFGTFAGTINAPDNGLTGRMTLYTDYGALTISVEEYKRPHFEVSFDTLRGDSRLTEIVNVKGFAKDYSGSVVSGGNVQYTVLRRAIFNNWWDSKYYSNYNQSTQIATGTTTTADDGSFTISFTAIPDLKLDRSKDPFFTYTVSADVTDITGETHSSTTYTNIGYVSVKAEMPLPEKINRDSAITIPIQTSNLNSIPVAAPVNVKIYDLKEPLYPVRKRIWTEPDKHVFTIEEYKQLFPNDIYAHEDAMENWERLSVVFTKEFALNDVKSFSTTSLKNLPAGAYCMDLIVTDKEGKSTTMKKFFTLYSTGLKDAPVPSAIWTDALKTYVEIGETLNWHVATSEKDKYVLFAIKWMNKITKYKWIKLEQGMNTITIPVLPEYKGNFAVGIASSGKNEFYDQQLTIIVADHRHDLHIKTQTFRNKIDPGKSEQWSFIVTGPDSVGATAELMASMYDASLDAFVSNNWFLNLSTSYYYYSEWVAQNGYYPNTSQFYLNNYIIASMPELRSYDHLNWHNLFYENNYGSHYNYKGNIQFGEDDNTFDQIDNRFAPDDYFADGISVRGGTKDFSATTVSKNAELPMGGDTGKKDDKDDEDLKPRDEQEQQGAQVRKNLQETAFFFPQLHTNEKGEVSFTFTSPEALTTWKLMLLAHTKDLRYDYQIKEVVTQKKLMMVPNAPRFLREKDDFYFTAKISNLSDSVATGTATLELFDALTNKPLNFFADGQKPEVPFSAKSKLNDVASWHLIIPVGIQVIRYQVIASTISFSDGEENILPVLSNRMLVTESVPLFVRGSQENSFTLLNLLNSESSSTQTNFKLTLQMTTNPAWYAVQALPYLMEYPYECAEQTFERYYANSLATQIANSNPTIKQVFESWETKDQLISALEKNEELKSLVLQETPWVREAQNESERKQRLGLLFNLNKMAKQFKQAEKKLNAMQVYSGGWPWFDGMPEDQFLTAYIVAGFGHLKKLGVDLQKENVTTNMIGKAVGYLDAEMQKEYNSLIKYNADLSKDHLYSFIIQYLYARSFFLNDFPLAEANKKSYDYYISQEEKFWLDKSLDQKGMISLSLNRNAKSKTAQNVVNSLKENSIDSKEMGMYWKANRNGYGWYDGGIETQSLIIEAFKEVMNDNVSVEEMKVWLIKQKQTQDWKTTTATANACYALLLTGGQWLNADPDVKITMGDVVIQSSLIPADQKEAGTGSFQMEWNGTDIKAAMGNIKISTNSTVPSWGGLFYQYFEDLNKIKSAETPLSLKKQLFVQRNNGKENILIPLSDTTKLLVGDLVVVRIELHVDRDMDYVHMKDMRASGLEPINVFSGYHWQDGLGYYQSTLDASTNFFFDHIHKGSYVFEYKLRANLKGTFSNGITNIECMYAPEFSSHSEGVTVKIDN